MGKLTEHYIGSTSNEFSTFSIVLKTASNLCKWANVKLQRCTLGHAKNSFLFHIKGRQQGGVDCNFIL